jgi:hypothetical protein
MPLFSEPGDVVDVTNLGARSTRLERRRLDALRRGS